MGFIYRDYGEADREKAKDLIAESFNLVDYAAPEGFELSKETDISNCLVDATFRRVAVSEDEVIGMLFGYAKCDITPELHERTLKEHEKCFSKFRCRDSHGSLNFRKVSEAYGKMLEGRDYDGCITVMAVSGEFKGKGVGTHLLEEAKAYHRSKGIGKAYLFSDSLCDYGFYEHNGFKRVAEGEVQRKKGEEKAIHTAYLYEFDY
jgi:GNAT superfamily N-acetyltransferase